MTDHPAVLNDPEPSVLADSLGTSTVNLRVYFWLDGRQHSWLKVRFFGDPARELAFPQHGISMPDEAREVVFPRGIPVTMLDGSPEQSPDGEPLKRRSMPPPNEALDAASTKVEGGLSSEAGVIKEQARHVKPLHEGENLLRERTLPVPPTEDAKRRK